MMFGAPTDCDTELLTFHDAHTNALKRKGTLYVPRLLINKHARDPFGSRALIFRTFPCIQIPFGAPVQNLGGREFRVSAARAGPQLIGS